ncbi:TonB-dependent receptor plug domain-containing protein [Thauera sp.]|uniref:TonB-dependent receptor plug domain-containing protein n=1 Tax=Thauera sp. TaxID=1905334 RepID=UPI0039E39A58
MALTVLGHRPKCRALCVAGVVATCWPPLQAGASEDVLRLLPLSLEELIQTPIITASHRVERRDDTPAHVIVITREQIRARRYRDLGELLSDLPGVDFMAGSRSSIFNNFSLQGFNSNNQLLIMLDGVRVDDPAGGKIAVARNFSLYMARQVEVVLRPGRGALRSRRSGRRHQHHHRPRRAGRRQLGLGRRRTLRQPRSAVPVQSQPGRRRTLLAGRTQAAQRSRAARSLLSR